MAEVHFSIHRKTMRPVAPSPYPWQLERSLTQLMLPMERHWNSENYSQKWWCWKFSHLVISPVQGWQQKGQHFEIFLWCKLGHISYSLTSLNCHLSFQDYSIRLPTRFKAVWYNYNKFIFLSYPSISVHCLKPKTMTQEEIYLIHFI